MADSINDPISSAAERVVGVLLRSPAASGLFVDFDGTLVPIVDDPERAAPVDGVIDSLGRLAATLTTVAVVSGRPGAFLLERFGAPRGDRSISLVGLYGAEEVTADGGVVRPHISGDVRGALEWVAAAARQVAPEARVEDKGESIALHYRESPEAEPVLRRVAADAVIAHALTLRTGRMVFELVPTNSPDKGDVVRRMAAGLDAVVAIGDDVGDIAAFLALDSLADGGATVLKIAVGGSESPAMLIELADLVVASPAEVAELLERVADTLGEQVRR